MAIYKKDGSIYRFSEPNKIMIHQDLWNKFQKHNMYLFGRFNKIDTNIEKNSHNVLDLTTKKQKEDIKSESNQLYEKIEKEEIKKEEIKIDSKKEISYTKEVVTQGSDQDNNQFTKYKKTIAHCLIAKVKEKVDDLYGDISKKVEYVDKFTAEIIILSVDDFNFKFFALIDKFSLDTIIYPQDKQKRWWQVVNIEDKFDGFIISCLPSKLQPSFG